MEALIIGIDPGSTSAVAGVNLDGELVFLESRKEFSQPEIIEEIIDHGKPIVIASDRKDMPSTVEKIAASMGAEKFEPDEDIPREKKKELGEGENSHEIDASASAFNAYRQMQKQVRKIKQRSGDDEAETALKYFSHHNVLDDSEDEPDPEPENTDKDREKDSLKSEIGELKKRNRQLEQRLEETEKGRRDSDIQRNEIRRLEEIIVNKNQELEQYRKLTRDLEDRLQRHEEALELVRKGFEPIRKVREGEECIPERSVTESDSLKQRLVARGYNARHIDELEAVDLENFVLVKDFPEPESIEKALGEDS